LSTHGVSQGKKLKLKLKEKKVVGITLSNALGPGLGPVGRGPFTI
jgi:hypothetical protein